VGAILGSTLGLVVLLGLLGFALRKPAGPLTIDKVLGTTMQVGALPVDWQPLITTALADGRSLALFGDPGDLPPADEMGSETSFGGPKGMGGGGGDDWRMRRFGGGGSMSGKFNPNSPWLRLPGGEPGHKPWQWALVHYPKSSAEATLAKEFGALQFQDLSQIPETGGSTPMDTGYIAWNGYKLPFVRIRYFRKQGSETSFHDVVRINMTRGTDAIVLYARWHPGQLGNIETLEPILAALEPVAANTTR